MIKSHGRDMRCVGCVIEGKWFVASINRSVVSGMAVLGGHKKDAVRVFAKVADVADWMRQYVDMAPRAEFVAAVEYIRSQMIDPP